MKRFLFQHWMLFSMAALITGAGWIVASRAAPGSMATSAPAPRQGFLAPEISLSNAGGELVTLSELQGNVVLVNFWASWCPPCIAEMPDLQQVYADYASQGFVILGINATDQDSAETALDFIEDHELTFPILFDVDGSVFSRYEVPALPTTYFIDRQGEIQEVVVGGPISEAMLRTRIEALLREKR